MALSALTAPFFALFMMLGGFNWQFASQTDANGNATVEISADENLNNVKVTIKGSDGTTVNKTVNLKAGKSTKITWKQKDRQVSYDIEIEANESFTNGNFEVQRPIAGGKQGALELVSDRDEIVDRQKVRYKTPFTITSLELTVFNTDGDEVFNKVVTDEVVEAGSVFEMAWNTTDDVFMVQVTGADDSGFSYTAAVVPYSVHIPHTEVNFDSGKAIIKPSEEPKVAESFAILAHELAGLDKANKAVNGNIVAQLYIVGYTDTVGNAADNQKLSEARAKAIAQYFLDKGAWCEIYYAGMGERGLAVQTGDNVDEVRNRRALYILDVQKPAPGGQVPSQSAWKKLADARPRMLQTLPDVPNSYREHKAEEQRKREEKFGGRSSSDDDDWSPSGGDGDDDWGKGSGSLSDDDDGGSSGSGSKRRSGPPAVKGEPGASKQGCAVERPGNVGALGMLAGLFALMGLRRRRVG
jgi:outer membrane protein OmpA-like peptidoglycan-associated protein